MKIYFLFLLFLCVMFTQDIYSQWEISSYYKYKNQVPEHGFGFAVARKLPFQFPSFGIKWRAGLGISNTSEEVFSEGKITEVDFTNQEINAEVIVTFFYQHIRPYFGLQVGAGRYSIEDFERYNLLLGVVGGIEIPISNGLHFFLELNPKNYFTEFDKTETFKEINSFQLNGKGGVVVKF